MNTKYPCAVGVICGLIGMGIALAGYGYALYYVRPVLWVVLAILAVLALFRKKLIQDFLHVLIIMGIATSLWYGGTGVRRLYKKLVCCEMNALINKVEDFHEKNGHYPARLNVLNFSTDSSVNVGRIGKSGFDLSDFNLAGVNEHPVTVYLCTNGFACVVPVTKMLPMNMTRFYVYIWTSAEPAWHYQKVIWRMRLPPKDFRATGPQGQSRVKN